MAAAALVGLVMVASGGSQRWRGFPADDALVTSSAPSLDFGAVAKAIAAGRPPGLGGTAGASAGAGVGGDGGGGGGWTFSSAGTGGSTIDAAASR